MTEILTALDLSTVNVAAIVPPTAPRTATHRVLHVINGEHYSGAERVQDLLAQELPACGFNVSFACVKPNLFPEARKEKNSPLYRTPMRGRFDLKCGQELARLIRGEKLDIIHAHTPRSLLAASIAAREAGVPLVYHVHSPTSCDSTRRLQNFINARIEHWLLRRAMKLIAVSPSLAELMVRQGFAADRVVYVSNGVPAVPPYPRQRPIGTWTLGMAALFRPRKGVEVLLQALAQLLTQGHDIRLRGIGPFETPDYQREVFELVDRLRIGEAIEWTGFVGNIHAELRRVDLFVLPSLFGEGLPMVVLEALAAGLPVVASRVEGVPIAIREGVDGTLVDPSDPEALANAIGEITNPASSLDYQAMCRNAREQHKTKFSAATMAQGVARVYREVLESRD